MHWWTENWLCIKYAGQTKKKPLVITIDRPTDHPRDWLSRALMVSNPVRGQWCGYNWTLRRPWISRGVELTDSNMIYALQKVSWSFQAIFRCVHASLCEDLSIRRSIGPQSVHLSIGPSIHWSIRPLVRLSNGQSVSLTVCWFIMRFSKTANSREFKKIHKNSSKFK